MICERIDLYKYFGVNRPENAVGYLNVLVQENYAEFSKNRLRPAMIVIAGGGYVYRSHRENECIALSYIENGFNAFTLEYSVAPVRYPAQLIEGAMAVAFVRENAGKYNIDPEHIAAIGFSAGGHLCGMLATLTGENAVKVALKEKAALCKPNAVVLSYPVIISGELAHKGSFDNLCGKDEKLKEYLSLDKRVTKDSVPAFIWTTVNDNSVPSESSLCMAMAYRKNGVSFELHMFEDGPHGLALCNEETITINKPVSKWIKLSKTWLNSRGFKIKD